MRRPLLAHKVGVTGCQFCHLVFQSAPGTSQRCPRCHSRLNPPDRKSLGRSCALLIAAVIAYIPANLSPVMFTSLFGRGKESTIMEGIVDFWNTGSYGIAVLIFTASVVIPCLKFFSIAVLLASSAVREPVGAKRTHQALSHYRMDWLLVHAGCHCRRCRQRTGSISFP